jgi:hypothetical protein
MTSLSSGSRTVNVIPAPRVKSGVAAKVGEVLLERHAVGWWPPAVEIAGSGADVLDA